MRKLLISGFWLLILIFFSTGFAFSQGKAEINFFFSNTCSHCAQEKSFLEKLKEENPEIKIKELSLLERENVDLLKKFYQDYRVPIKDQGLVPITFFSDLYFLGFDEKIGEEIKNYFFDLEGEPAKGDEISKKTSLALELEKKLTLPVFGKIDIEKIGLFAFSILVGILDGFNVCAMWALFFLLSFLVASGSRKRIFLIGGSFILVSGIVYFLFISAWLNLFLIIGYLKIIQTIISLLAVVFGLFCVKDFFAFGKGISFVYSQSHKR